MATETHKFQVGLFVIAASLIAVGTVIWLGASHLLEENQKFVTYFAESVQGLEPGSAVKYRGVPAGRVDAIRIAPDGELIEVLMDIDVQSASALKRDQTIRATLELSGITGLRYIEIDRRTGEALLQSPQFDFHTDYEVIPSARSSFKAVQSALADVYAKVMQLDIGGISNDARSTLQAADSLLRDKRIDRLLSDLGEISKSVNQLAKNMRDISADVRVGPIVDNLTQVSADARALLGELNGGATGKKLEGALDEVYQLSRRAQQTLAAAEASLDRVDRAAHGFEALAEDLRAQPSSLLFGNPPVERARPEEGR